jgi:hypothetical protein
MEWDPDLLKNLSLMTPSRQTLIKRSKSLREKDVSINREQRQVGDPEGLSILEEITILRDRIKTIEQRNEAIEKKSELILC